MTAPYLILWLIARWGPERAWRLLPGRLRVWWANEYWTRR